MDKEFIKLRVDAVTDVLDNVGDDRWLEDGVYNLDNIDYLLVHDWSLNDDLEKIEKFVATYPNFFEAKPYETSTIVLLSKKPEKIWTHKGSGFNYGSCNIISNCP